MGGPEFKPEENDTRTLPVRLILCLDGTCNTAEGSYSAIDGVTNGTKSSVRIIYDLAKTGVVENSSGKRYFQLAEYFEGIGTVGAVTDPGLRVRAGALFDAATGSGYLEILKRAYKVCCQTLQRDQEDEIFIFGFSRGAFISRALASFLQHVGLISSDKEEIREECFDKTFSELLRKYCDLIKKAKMTPPDLYTNLMPFCKPSPRVRLVGAFDTVKTIIPLPVHNYLFHGIPNIDFEMDAPRIVDHFRHALALNEARPLFSPGFWKSDAHSPESSYLEAWFFGYHRDVGGGNAQQGLALWPLQWILHAAVDYGMVLGTEKPYDVLFSGKDNTIESHEIVMKMFDMIGHHSIRQDLTLRLNKPSSFGPLQPRNYLTHLTTPPYTSLVKPRVLLHPSAYLIFDVSSSFRVQVYEWKYIRNFLRDRAKTLSTTTAPWWERQTIDSILEEGPAVQHLNILVYGRPRTGKSYVISRTFGEGFMGETRFETELKSGVARTHNINTPISIPGNDQVQIYLSEGFGPGGSDKQDDVKEFLARYRAEPSPEKQIHAVWYFLDCTDEDVGSSEKEFFHLQFGDIPRIALLQNQNRLRDRLHQDFSKTTDETEEPQFFHEIIKKKLEEIQPFGAHSILHARSPADTPKDLLAESSIHFKSHAIQMAQIKAQRILVKPKVALATEEAVRAYTIWYSCRFSGKQTAFRRNRANELGLKLSLILMEPILATFNMRFPGDDELIRSKIGNQWTGLDVKSGLWDRSLSGDLILMCMVDTIMVVTHAFSNQEIDGAGHQGIHAGHQEMYAGHQQIDAGHQERATPIVRPLSAADINRSCAWYMGAKDNRQTVVHRKLGALLLDDGSPAEKSIACLQMRLIELVEQEADTAEHAKDGIHGFVKNLWSRFSS